MQADAAMLDLPGGYQQDSEAMGPASHRSSCKQAVTLSLLGNLAPFNCIQAPAPPLSYSRNIDRKKTDGTNAHLAGYPDLIKRLKKYIQETTHDIGLARTSFNVVEKNIGKMDLKSEHREELAGIWGNIRTVCLFYALVHF